MSTRLLVSRVATNKASLITFCGHKCSNSTVYPLLIPSIGKKSTTRRTGRLLGPVHLVRMVGPVRSVILWDWEGSWLGKSCMGNSQRLRLPLDSTAWQTWISRLVGWNAVARGSSTWPHILCRRSYFSILQGFWSKDFPLCSSPWCFISRSAKRH